MIFIPFCLFLGISIAALIRFRSELKEVAIIAGIFLATSIVITVLVSVCDIGIRTSDIEVWSGHVEDWEHKEEWDEWHPPKTTCTTDSKGKESCKTEPGYWEHHDAENRIKTTDDGWNYVDKSPDGKKEFDDSWPNKTSELEKLWPKGTPSASTHPYTNKVAASYSIFKNKDINLEDFKGLPAYPDKVTNFIEVNRLIGDVPNKKAANELLAKMNTDLNKMVKGKDGKERSWKQVNLIFVNVGADKPRDWGFALQDSWENGNKNDFIVSFSMNKDGKLNWVYPFSWSESERLKIDVREALMEKETITDIVPVIDEVTKLVIDKYERKEFKDFDYLTIEVSTAGVIVIWILHLIALGAFGYIIFQSNSSSRYY